MIFIDELKNLTLYKRPLFLPINEKNKRKGSVAFLLTPNYNGTKTLLSNEMLVKKYYESYYIEKDITYFINQEGYIELEVPNEVLNESEIAEANHPLFKYLDSNREFAELVFDDYQQGKNVFETDISNTLKDIKSLNRSLKYRMRKPINALKHDDPTDPSATKDQIEKDDEIKKKGVFESDLTSADKKKLPDSDFGIPEQKKYPMPDKQHVLLAIRFFNHVDSDHEKELADNINKKIKKYKMENEVHVGEKNRFSKYYKEPVEESYQIGHLFEDYQLDDVSLRVGNTLILFNENLDEQVLSEANKEYNPILRKLLFKERFKTPKEVMKIYDQVEKDLPFITKTFLDYNKYQKLNLFVDLSFYNQTFFKNNIYKLDKGVDLYFEFLTRFLQDSRLEPAGYNNKAVFIPVDEWSKEDVKIFNYTEDINPISMIYRLMKNKKLETIQEQWGNLDFIFISSTGYFKINFSEMEQKDLNEFVLLLNKLKDKNTVIQDDNTDSKKAIVANIVDKIEDTQNVKIDNISGEESKDPDKSDNEKLKDNLVSDIKKTTTDGKTEDDVLDDIDNNKIKNIIATLAAEEDNTVKINAARSARFMKLNNEFMKKNIQGETVKDMLANVSKNEPLPTTSLELDTVNEGWKDLKYMNFEKIYKPQEDIVNMLYSFSKRTVPVMVRDINIEDSSTTEDYKETWNVQLEDVNGTRFTLKFDIPKLKEDKFMVLGGNEKTINAQLTLIPVIKTDVDTVQIITNYKKIFIRRFGSVKGKSFVVADRIIKALNKEDQPFKVTPGDNTKICTKYELPIDYIDLASQFSRIETDKFIIYFNQDEIRNKYKDSIDTTKGLPFGYDKAKKEILYYNQSYTFSNILQDCLNNEKFNDIYNSTNLSSKYMYSQASILAAKIPLVVLMSYNEGLTKVMKKAGIKYDIVEKRPSYDKSLQDIIRFKDAYILYDLTYESSLLMNGLKECGTELYSISEINSKSMYLDFLDLFGGRLLADGLDNFYDLMIDPITEDILKYYKLPTDYIDVLCYANALLADNKYIKHTNQAGRRYRSNEIIAGYAYQALSDSYGNYRTKLKRTPKSTMMIKQNEVINKILLDPTASDLSTLNPLLELECINAVSTKGLVGMNTERSYNLDKRAFDKSMLNVLGLSTGFAGNVGISRQATIDSNIEGKRGFIKVTEDPNNVSVTKTLTVTEALTPFGTNMDDPFRSAMTFIQTAKHGMRTVKSMPMLISNGMDQALPYMITNKFAFKTKEAGKVIEKTDDYMIIQYKSGKNDFVDLRPKIVKNSDGGFYLTLKLDSDYKVGKTFKENEIVAYDKLSFSDEVGHTDNIAYNLGPLVKFACMNTDEGYEDSAIISEWLSEAMASEVVVKKEKYLPKNTNVYNMVKKGDEVQEGDPLIIFQTAFEEDDVNALLKNLVDDDDAISDLGRIKVKAKITGKIEDVKIYRTVEKDELSESLKKKVNEFDNSIGKMKKIMKKYDADTYGALDPDYKLDPTGKLKGAPDGVYIEFYIKYFDKLSVGDKIIYYSALKGVVKDIYPKGKEPFTDFRRNEKIHTTLSVQSVDARMVCSVIEVAALNKLIIETDRYIKDMLGIKWKYLDED